MLTTFGLAGSAINLVIGAILIFVERWRQGRHWLLYAAAYHTAICAYYLISGIGSAGVPFSTYIRSLSGVPAIVATALVAVLLAATITSLYGRTFSNRMFASVSIAVMVAVAAISLIFEPIVAFTIAQSALIGCISGSGLFMLRGPTAFYRLVGVSFLGRAGFLVIVLYSVLTDHNVAMIDVALIFNLIFICMTGLGMVLIELDDTRALVAEANASKSMFIANMSHELRTPLNAILGFSEILELQGGKLSADRIVEYGTYILTSGRHLLSIVNQLLDMAAIEAGREALDRTVVDVDRVITDCLNMLMGEADAKGVVLKVVKSQQSISLETSERAIRQIVLCLTGNAIKFSRAGSVVTISLEPSDHGHGMCLSVSDHGPGIAEAHLNRVFEPFWQLDGAYARQHGGIGLGLPIARSLARKIGGDIKVRSELGRGSTFMATFP